MKECPLLQAWGRNSFVTPNNDQVEIRGVYDSIENGGNSTTTDYYSINCLPFRWFDSMYNIKDHQVV